MKNCDLIFTNAQVLCMDFDFHQFSPGAVAVLGDLIAAVGPQEEILKTYTTNRLIDCAGKVLMPGLINAHTHVPMNLLRGLADDLRLDVWLQGYMLPVEREFVSPEFVKLGTMLACAELIRTGVTTFCDMYYFEEDVALAAEISGLRAICGETIIKYPSPDAQSYEESIEYAKNFIKNWKNHPRIIPAIAPHSAYTCTEEIIKACVNLSLQYDIPLITHIAETAFEVDNSRNENGMPVVPFVKKMGIFETKVIAAHCVHIDEGEMHTLQHYNAGVIHNPSSNLKLGSGIAPISHMLDLNLNVGIGTDGVASNNDLDMFEEIRLATFLAKGSTGDPTSIPAKTALLMATRMGAQSLHIDHITGSIESGKKADLIIVDINQLHNSPRFSRSPDSIYAQLVYASKSTDVTDVMVDGNFIMRDRELIKLNEAILMVEAQKYAKEIDSFLINREGSVLAKLIAIGTTSEEETFEVQAKVPINNIQLAVESLKDPQISILKKRHYKEYDTYFSFQESDQGWLRYREDHFIGPAGIVTHVRNRLTLIGPTVEHNFPQKVLLSRSRYISSATQSLRFYREYFQPECEFQIDKERLRFQIQFMGTEFYVNLDMVINPDLGSFLEVKSRTWSRSDANIKSKLIPALIEILGAKPEKAISEDYIEMLKI